MGPFPFKSAFGQLGDMISNAWPSYDDMYYPGKPMSPGGPIPVAPSPSPMPQPQIGNSLSPAVATGGNPMASAAIGDIIKAAAAMRAGQMPANSAMGAPGRSGPIGTDTMPPQAPVTGPSPDPMTQLINDYNTRRQQMGIQHNGQPSVLNPAMATAPMPVDTNKLLMDYSNAQAERNASERSAGNARIKAANSLSLGDTPGAIAKNFDTNDPQQALMVKVALERAAGTRPSPTYLESAKFAAKPVAQAKSDPLSGANTSARRRGAQRDFVMGQRQGIPMDVLAADYNRRMGLPIMQQVMANTGGQQGQQGQQGINPLLAGMMFGPQAFQTAAEGQTARDVAGIQSGVKDTEKLADAGVIPLAQDQQLAREMKKGEFGPATRNKLSEIDKGVSINFGWFRPHTSRLPVFVQKAQASGIDPKYAEQWYRQNYAMGG